MINILSHRGCWTKSEEKNSLLSITKSFELNFGIETDLRDFNSEIVISHDIPSSNNYSLEVLLKTYSKYQFKNLQLALNIKADGLHFAIKKLIEKYSLSNFFVFDMSVPDTINYINLSIPFFTRQSEYEQMPAFYEKASGVWLDAFREIWYKHELILHHIDNNKKVVMVSPELHGREHIDFWNFLKEHKIHLLNEVSLCTDFPIEANTYFK